MLSDIVKTTDSNTGAELDQRSRFHIEWLLQEPQFAAIKGFISALKSCCGSISCLYIYTWQRGCIRYAVMATGTLVLAFSKDL